LLFLLNIVAVLSTMIATLFRLRQGLFILIWDYDSFWFDIFIPFILQNTLFFVSRDFLRIWVNKFIFCDFIRFFLRLAVISISKPSFIRRIRQYFLWYTFQLLIWSKNQRLCYYFWLFFPYLSFFKECLNCSRILWWIAILFSTMNSRYTLGVKLRLVLFEGILYE